MVDWLKEKKKDETLTYLSIYPSGFDEVCLLDNYWMGLRGIAYCFCLSCKGQLHDHPRSRFTFESFELSYRLVIGFYYLFSLFFIEYTNEKHIIYYFDFWIFDTFSDNVSILIDILFRVSYFFSRIRVNITKIYNRLFL